MGRYEVYGKETTLLILDEKLHPRSLEKRYVYERESLNYETSKIQKKIMSDYVRTIKGCKSCTEY